MTPDERKYLWQDLEAAVRDLRAAISDGVAEGRIEVGDALEAIDDTIAALRTDADRQFIAALRRGTDASDAE